MKSRRGQLPEDVHVLDRVDAGERGLDARRGVLVHEDGQAARVRAGARAAGRVGAHRNVELDAVHSRIGQRVDLGLRARGVEPPAETGEARVRVAFLQHRPGEEDARAGPGSRFDRLSVRRDVVELAAEIEHGGDPGGKEQLGMPLVLGVRRARACRRDQG
jgi:hypothetical protein